MTQYLLSVYATDSDYDTSPEDMQPVYAAVDTFNQALMADGSWVFGGGLQRLESATTVDGTRGDAIVTDGPFTTTKEYLGGFWVIEAPDLDAALKVAAGASKACGGKIEVRPFQGE